MHKGAIVFSIEKNIDEDKYEYMSILLALSILDQMPEVDVYCGIFTNREPDYKVIEALDRYGVKIVKDLQFKVPDDSINYFLRNYTKFYFSNKMNLLEKYENFVYLDIDVLVLKPLDFDNFSNKIYTERVPMGIKLLEEEYTGEVNHDLFFNWFDVITIDNKHIYDMD